MKKDQNGFGLILIILAVLTLILIIGVGWHVLNINGKDSINTVNPSSSSTSPSSAKKSNSCKENLTTELNSEIVLSKNCFVTVIGNDLEVGVTEFYNSPCPSNAQCIWSGIGTKFEYRHRGEVKEGIDLVQAFGYQTNILDTDHETYIKLSISKIK